MGMSPIFTIKSDFSSRGLLPLLPSVAVVLKFKSIPTPFDIIATYASLSDSLLFDIISSVNIVGVSDDLAVERDTPASSLFTRGESSLVFKPVFCSSFMERVVLSSAFMALALAFRAFTDHSLVVGLKKDDFRSALLQISTYRSLEDWISFVEEVAAASVLSTASGTVRVF
ncbi:hypothetical protein IGI04_033333 [Brassica rapa subsp. trilocularis]|uniref:Uncharacterized protein n=1 Tax=Brassica rapa subsp. trilocularis TaxID=1813537 RepID=A0ABQ7L5K4_BRACM|nr:hypothetical protein IGI04_033333 [Brassica rapa subsp. trilocularis]